MRRRVIHTPSLPMVRPENLRVLTGKHTRPPRLRIGASPFDPKCIHGAIERAERPSAESFPPDCLRRFPFPQEATADPVPAAKCKRRSTPPKICPDLSFGYQFDRAKQRLEPRPESQVCGAHPAANQLSILKNLMD